MIYNSAQWLPYSTFTNLFFILNVNQFWHIEPKPKSQPARDAQKYFQYKIRMKLGELKWLTEVSMRTPEKKLL